MVSSLEQYGFFCLRIVYVETAVVVDVVVFIIIIILNVRLEFSLASHRACNYTWKRMPNEQTKWMSDLESVYTGFFEFSGLSTWARTVNIMKGNLLNHLKLLVKPLAFSFQFVTAAVIALCCCAYLFSCKSFGTVFKCCDFFFIECHQTFVLPNSVKFDASLWLSANPNKEIGEWTFIIERKKTSAINGYLGFLRNSHAWPFDGSTLAANICLAFGFGNTPILLSIDMIWWLAYQHSR